MNKLFGLMKTIVLISCLLLPIAAFSQILVEIPVQEYANIEELEIIWKDIQGSSAFILINELTELNSRNVDYQILDEISDADQYYWFYVLGVAEFDWRSITKYDEIQVLWNENNTALAKITRINFPWDFPSIISKRRIFFAKATSPPISEDFQFNGWSPEEIRAVQVVIDSVNIDSIYYTEEHLTGLEPFHLSTGPDSLRSRHSFNSDIFTAQQYLKERLENYGYVVNEHPFSLSGNTLYNIEAVKPGTRFANQFFILCAHYDDMPSGPLAPGADDNGSGTATVVEAARVMKNLQFEYSIRFVLFPGEEQGLWGSYYYAQAASVAGDSILGVINMDMIGFDSNDDAVMEIHAGNMSSSQQIGTLMVNNASSWGLGLIAQYKTSNSSGASDHASFWQFNFPAVMQIEDFQDFNSYYHTVNDRLSAMAMSYFMQNAKLSVGTLAVLAVLDNVPTGITSDPLPEDFVLEDPYPNPFNPIVSLKYKLPQAGQVTVNIFDVLGRPIKNLLKERQNPGWNEVTWNAINDYGNPVSSGIYFIQVESDYGRQMKKVVLVR